MAFSAYLLWPSPKALARMGTLVKRFGAIGLVAIGVQILRLFVLPGAANRRKWLGYYVLNFGGRPKGLPDVPEVSHLSKRVTRVLGMNPGTFTLQGTNTYLVGTGKDRILIDTSDGNSKYIEVLAKTLYDQKATIAHIVITHDHMDHVGGITQLQKLFPNATTWKRLKSSIEVDPGGRAYDNPLENGSTISVEGATLRAVLTPGHSKDHVALVLEEEDGAIFTGDCVLSSGTVVFEDLYQYMGSLRILLHEITSRRETPKLYPGHGPLVVDGFDRIQEYLAHRQLREDQIIALLNSKVKHQTIDEMTDHIYADQHLSWIVRKGAVNSVEKHLRKLEREGKVTSTGKAWRITEKGQQHHVAPDTRECR
mmetsp:Transcript_20740/g.38587  ORF Transcript_20740/g.38587 Transcript_20740/m.38587 type:complete len:367 (-) Transcript_20740:1567-2667(-)